MHYAVVGFQNIKKLSESALISEKLLGLNTLVYVLIMAVLISSFLGKTTEIFSLEFLIFFGLGILFALISSLIYSPIIEVVANFSEDKVGALRIGLVTLFVALPTAVAGLVFQKPFVIKIALAVVGLQILLILFGSVIKYSKETTKDVKVGASDLWKVIDKFGAISSIISFLITILLLIFK